MLKAVRAVPFLWLCLAAIGCGSSTAGKPDIVIPIQTPDWFDKLVGIGRHSSGGGRTIDKADEVVSAAILKTFQQRDLEFPSPPTVLEPQVEYETEFAVIDSGLIKEYNDSVGRGSDYALPQDYIYGITMKIRYWIYDHHANFLINPTIYYKGAAGDDKGHLYEGRVQRFWFAEELTRAVEEEILRNRPKR